MLIGTMARKCLPLIKLYFATLLSGKSFFIHIIVLLEYANVFSHSQGKYQTETQAKHFHHHYIPILNRCGLVTPYCQDHDL